MEADKNAAQGFLNALPGGPVKDDLVRLLSDVKSDLKLQSDSMIVVVRKNETYRLIGLEEHDSLNEWVEESTSNSKRGIFKCLTLLVAACSPRVGRTFSPRSDGEEAETIQWLVKDVIKALPPGTWDTYEEVAVPVLEFFQTGPLLHYLEKNPDKINAVLSNADGFTYDANVNICVRIKASGLSEYRLFPQIIHYVLGQAAFCVFDRGYRKLERQFFGIQIWNNEEFQNLVKSRMEALYQILGGLQSDIKVPMIHMRSKTLGKLCGELGAFECSQNNEMIVLRVYDHPVAQVFGNARPPTNGTKLALSAPSKKKKEKEEKKKKKEEEKKKKEEEKKKKKKEKEEKKKKKEEEKKKKKKEKEEKKKEDPRQPDPVDPTVGLPRQPDGPRPPMASHDPSPQAQMAGPGGAQSPRLEESVHPAPSRGGVIGGDAVRMDAEIASSLWVKKKEEEKKKKKKEKEEKKKKTEEEKKKKKEEEKKKKKEDEMMMKKKGPKKWTPAVQRRCALN